MSDKSQKPHSPLFLSGSGKTQKTRYTCIHKSLERFALDYYLKRTTGGT